VFIHLVDKGFADCQLFREHTLVQLVSLQQFVGAMTNEGIICVLNQNHGLLSTGFQVRMSSSVHSSRIGQRMRTCLNKKYIPYITLLLVTCSTVYYSACARASSEQQLANTYGAWFHLQVRQEAIVGAAYAIVSRDRIIGIGTEGKTKITGNDAITENTPFRVASVSKTFAAGLTAQLVRDGQLDWDDPINRYLPEFRIKGNTELITIREVLGQSSGLIPHAYDNLIEDGIERDEVFRQLRKLSYICQPGQCYSYQNSVFSLLEPVIEKATADSYERLMTERIFVPLDMRTASVGYESFMQHPDRARPHVKRKGQWKTTSVVPNYYAFTPAAGVNASVLDMAKWLQAQLGGNPAVMQPDLMALLTTPRLKTRRELYRKEWRDLLTNAHYGLGWRVYQLGEQEIAYHSGWVSGFRADVAWSKQLDIGIAVLLNVEGTSINALTARFWEMAIADHSKGQNIPVSGQ
jgi:beta-lactamase class C